VVFRHLLKSRGNTTIARRGSWSFILHSLVRKLHSPAGWSGGFIVGERRVARRLHLLPFAQGTGLSGD
jgi:hypothetical protein